MKPHFPTPSSLPTMRRYVCSFFPHFIKKGITKYIIIIYIYLFCDTNIKIFH